MKQLISSTLLAGMLAVAGSAMAQKPEPVQPGASVDAPVSRDAVRTEARIHNRTPANSLTPGGEASTTINHQPNVMPTPISDTTRAEVRQQTYKTRPTFRGGEKGERPDVPTNPAHETGTPK
ncbi:MULTISPECIES: serine/threonine protein kinase [unclassified Variovorax]|uniref:serine/threonine protein kinase n=1 Tax=unclassified Variovorax TaxID=663243 RepID=UPI001BD67E53|nr:MULTISPECIES: serine/threonine protein kinase [unclassified Variovorax]